MFRHIYMLACSVTRNRLAILRVQRPVPNSNMQAEPGDTTGAAGTASGGMKAARIYRQCGQAGDTTGAAA